MIIPTCSLCQTWANPSVVEFQRTISSVRKSWEGKFCDFLFMFWSHQMGNKSFSYPSKSCSDSKQNLMLRDLLDLSRDVFGLLSWLKEFKMLEKSQWLVCSTISMLNFSSVKEQFSFFFLILIPFCRITDLERTIQGFQNELDNLPDPSELQVDKIHVQ